VLSLVRRGRVRLEAIRIAKAAARGVLLGGGLGLLAVVVDRLAVGLALPGWLAWVFPAVGACGFGVAAAVRGRIDLVATALLLDDRLGTDQRITTLVAAEPGPFLPRVLAGLEGVERLPRLPFPREIPLVPAALFLLFVAGLLPAANGEEAAERAWVGRAESPVDAASAPQPDVRDAVKRLARGEAPATASSVSRLREAIDKGLHRPEDRHAARAELDRAIRGDGAAAREVAARLEALQGGGGLSGELEGHRLGAVGAEGGRRGELYPEDTDLVLAYRRALVEEETR